MGIRYAKVHLSDNMTCPVLIQIKPVHEGEHVTGNAGQQAAKQEELANMWIALEAVVNDSPNTS
jgi:hypothetical protein